MPPTNKDELHFPLKCYCTFTVMPIRFNLKFTVWLKQNAHPEGPTDLLQSHYGQKSEARGEVGTTSGARDSY